MQNAAAEVSSAAKARASSKISTATEMRNSPAKTRTSSAKVSAPAKTRASAAKMSASKTSPVETSSSATGPPRSESERDQCETDQAQ